MSKFNLEQFVQIADRIRKKAIEEGRLRGCPKTRILALRGDLNSKGKRALIGGKRETIMRR